MKNKELKFDLEAKEAIKKGIDILGNAVKATLGPKGQCVVIADYHDKKPHVTKDGVTVAKNIQLKDKYANAGACLIREASLKMLSTCGDSTSTSTVLAQEMVQNAIEKIEEDCNRNKLQAKERASKEEFILINLIRKHPEIESYYMGHPILGY